MNADKVHYYCFKELSQGVVLHIRVQPKASKNQIVGLYGSPPRLKVRIAAPPSDGKANDELLRFLSKILNVSVSHLKIIRGETSKNKDILCEGISLEEIKNLLLRESQLS